MALSDKEMVAHAGEGPKHIMLSYNVRVHLFRDLDGLCRLYLSADARSLLPQWDAQAMILRIHSSLCNRGYLVWIDTEMMKGSTMDAMSEAIEGSDVVCYGVSLA